MSSPKDGDNMGKGWTSLNPLTPGFFDRKIEPKTHHPTNASEPRAPVCSEPGKENSLTPSPEMATKPLAFAPAVNGATCPNGVPNVKDAAAAENGSDIDLDLKL
ncbi:hypothetical protein DCAR_0103373 [Daucus carota subsp. sativus]|uniref:Uncharacterized protein n=1 Tax=Daucus carota subsp. sativus TaxID=79200 RepID=A0A166HY81_DAUCS|nr:hypothetical protein DCAR_0103373 [Daucus carota subsp. sativus]